MFFNDLQTFTNDFIRNSEERSYRDRDFLLRKEQAESIAKMAAELEALRRDLASTKEELARYQAQQAKQREADAVQAELDRNKVFRHEYRVAGFSILLTFLAERICDLAQLDEVLLQWVSSLFQ